MTGAIFSTVPGTIVDIAEVLARTAYAGKVSLDTARRALKVAFNCAHIDYLSYEIGKEFGHRLIKSIDDRDEITLSLLAIALHKEMRILININLTKPIED